VLSRQPAGCAVVLLHERAEVDLRLFAGAASGPDTAGAVLFCLGAVRDMSSEEVGTVLSVAKRLGLPAIRCRVGYVAEFTSKVVRCLVTAHQHGLVLPAVERALNRSCAMQPADPGSPDSVPIRLRVVAQVPFASGALSGKLAVRAKMLHVVQLCVCVLWRSGIADELASQSRRADTHFSDAHLHLVFSDGCTLVLGKRFVARLSRQHRAAPTECQVLEALLESMAQQAKQQKSHPDAGTGIWECLATAFTEVVEHVSKHGELASAFAVILAKERSLQGLPEAAAALRPQLWTGGPPSELLLLLPHNECCSHGGSEAEVTAAKAWCLAAEAACRNGGICSAWAHIAGGSASAVTLVQFMHYSGHLLPALQGLECHARLEVPPAGGVPKPRRKRKAAMLAVSQAPKGKQLRKAVRV